jgi:ACS family sodium-dependent inorganic phosphate cotransporter-like MFS transporter 5
MAADDDAPSFFISTRFLLAVTIFFGVGFQYTQKIDMGIAVVCMVNSSTSVKNERHHSLAELIRSDQVNSSNETCLFNPVSNNSTHDNKGTFNWSKPVQGLILSAYFYGYILTQIPGGWLSMKYGGKIVLAASMFAGSLLTIALAPAASLGGYKALIALRFLIGLSHGFMWPAISAMFVRWACKEEKSRLIGFACSGTNIGNVFALQLGGILCSVGFYHGWGSIFVLFGLCGVVWVMAFTFLTSNSPLNHRFINDQEKQYLIRNISKADLEINNTETTRLLSSQRVSFGNLSPPTASFLTISVFINSFI